MKKIYLLTIALFFLYCSKLNAQAPTYQWVKNFGGPSCTSTTITSTATDKFGSVFITGRLIGTADFDPGPGTTNLVGDCCFFGKYGSAGNLIWIKKLGTGGIFSNDIKVDQLGGVYLTGRYTSTLDDFDPDAGVTTMAYSQNDAYLAKYDGSGNFLFVKRGHTSSTLANLIFNTIIVDTLTNVISIGGSAGTTTSSTKTLYYDGVAFDVISNSLTKSTGFTTDYSGNYIAVNYNYSKLMDIDTVGNFCSVHTYTLFSNNYIKKINAAGALLWQIPFDSGVKFTGISFDDSGNEYVTGYLDYPANQGATINFNPIGSYYPLVTGTSRTCFIAKYDNSGALVWAGTFGNATENDETYTCAVIGNNALYVTGYFSGTADFDYGPGTFNLTATGDQDGFLLKYDLNGAFEFAQKIGPVAVSTEQLTRLVEYPSGGFILGGNFTNTSDFDFSTGVANVTAVSAGGGSNAFVGRYASCSGPTTATENQTACNSYTWPLNGTTYTSSGVYTHLETSGCPLTTTLNLTINVDNVAPVPNIASLSTITASCSVTSLTAPTATDNCAGTLTATHNTSLPITAQGTTTVTWTYNDGNGNTAAQTQNVVIDDVTASVPNIASLSNVTGSCSVTSLNAPTATDNCAGTITGTHNVTLPITFQGTTTVTWTYDDGNGNTSTQTQNVVIDDITAPVANQGSLAAIVTNCGQSVTSLTAPTATDNCMGTITGTHNASLPITSSTTITWTYNDGNGNTSTQNQTVTINVDNVAPVANLGSLAAIVTNCGQSVTSLTAPIATDNCAGTITGTHNASLPITSSTTITWTYNDGNGNTSTQNQTVTINVDNVEPVANVATLSDVTSQCSVTSLTAPTATDNCAGTITATHNASLPITTQGTTVVTWSYNDGNGNTSTQTQSIVINDVTNPVATLANLPTITSECDVTPVAPTATDNCSGTLSGTSDISFPITASGTTVVTWTYDDGNGNTSGQTQNVVITPIDNGIAQNDAITLSANASGYSYQWVDCANGNQAISGATSQMFVATLNGNYAVEVDNGTCTVTSDCIMINSVGVKEFGDAELIAVYPNPTRGNVKIILGKEYQNTSIKLINALGQTILHKAYSSTDEITFEIEGASGMYFLEIESAEQALGTIRVIKN